MRQSIYLLSVVYLLLLPSALVADDWPTHRHDNSRSGRSTETLSLPLAIHWSLNLPGPKPAWPEPAKQDYWNRKTNLRPRVVHDRANGIVVADGRLVIGSSSDDQVRALDASTGNQLWTAFAEGPIRLAPTIWKDMVVFASDDGFAYGVAADSGELRWKTRPPQVGPRRIPGNGRIISERPIRSGVMINDDGTGFFAAGIFPKQGAYFFSIDVRNGNLLDDSVIKKSVQGYLEIRDGRVFAPTGRDPHGVTLDDSKQKHRTTKTKTLPARVYSSISDAAHEYVGRENQVVATKDRKEVWTADVAGRVYSMAIADGRLFVSTDSGNVYAFGAPSDGRPHINSALATDDRDTDSQVTTAPKTKRSAAESEPKDPLRPGYVLFVSPTEQQLFDVIELARNPRVKHVVVAVEKEVRANQLREALTRANVYGKAVVHIHESLDDLPYAENIFQQVVGGDANAKMPLPQSAEQETERAEWTHAYGNAGNTASSQAHVGAKKMRLQWFGGPGPRNMVDRHMRTMPPLVCNGTMYIPGLDRVIAVDAFTGVTIWEEQIAGSTRIGMLKDCGWMAAREKTNELFVAVGDELLKFEPNATGAKQSVEAKVPAENREWGYLACIGPRIVGSTTLKNAARRTITRSAILEGAYSDNRPIVCSDRVFVFSNGKRSWTYTSAGAILNPTIAATESAIFFVENEIESFEDTKIGRVVLADFWKTQPKLTALDLKSGKRLWSIDLPAMKKPQNAFLLCNDERVMLVNSRNDRTVHYDVRVYQSSDGDELWTASQDNLKKLGGDHGEQDKHPVLVGNRLIVEPIAYDLETGHKLTELNLSKRGYGCGTLSASADALFFRSGNPASYSLKTNKIELVTSVSRPGCWINMIPAEGLLLIPEGSSGCTCNFAVQTSMAFTTK